MSGYNSRLDEIQAALLRVKLGHIEGFNAQRQQVAQWYREFLKDTEVLFQENQEGHIYHQFTVVLPSNRNAVKKRLARKGIASAIYYPLPLNRQRALAGLAGEHELPVCEQLSEHCLSLPIYPGMTRRQVETVTSTFINVMY